MALDPSFLGDEQDDERQSRLARIAPPNLPGALPPANLRGLNVPIAPSSSATPTSSSSPPATPGSSEDLEQRGLESHLRPAPIAKPSAIQADTQGAENEIARERATGSGISQIKNRPLRIGLRTLDTIGEIAAPRIVSQIPGTEGYHQRLIRQQEGRLGEDLGAEEKEAQTENLNAQPELKEQANDLKEQQNENQREKSLSTLREQYRKLGLKLDDQGNTTPISYAEMAPTEQAAHDLKESQANLSTLRGQLEKSKNDPNSPLYKQTQEKINAELERSKQAAERLGLSAAQFQNKLQEQELLKPSGQAQSRGSSAQAALDILPELETQIRSNAENLGPIMGRLAKGEIALGDVDPKIAKLYSSLSSFYALNPSIHGFRNYELVKDMPSLIGGLSRDPEGTIAGLEGLKPTLESVAKEGRTFHKRVVEGRDNNEPSTNATPTNNPNDPLGILPKK